MSHKHADPSPLHSAGPAAMRNRVTASHPSTGGGGRVYPIDGNPWHRTQITYQISRYPRDLNPDDVKAAFQTAFSWWSKAGEPEVTLTFVPVESGDESQTVDIAIRFFDTDCHGDDAPFSEDSEPGERPVLAHTYYPIEASGELAGEIHFNDQPNQNSWWVASADGTPKPPIGQDEIDLVTVAAHEIGHALGITHSDEQLSPLFHHYIEPRQGLHQTDIDKFRELYVEGKTREVRELWETRGGGPKPATITR